MTNEVTPTQADADLWSEIFGGNYEHRSHDIALIAAHRIAHEAPLLAQIAELGEKYDELLFAVAMKHPGETRHQTALRYILGRERQSDGEAQQALATKDTSHDA